MIYRRKTYKIHPDMAEQFTAFFEQYLLPNQLKHGASLVGRWVTESRDEIVALWEYSSHEAYQRIEAAVRQDPMHMTAQAKRSELGQLFIESLEDFLEPTGAYAHPHHMLSVSGYITNAAGEVLIVRTDWRSDTWELPGGQVEEGEEPLQFVRLAESNMAVLITRPHFRTRILDAMTGQTAPYEAFRLRPYELLRREE